MCHRALWGYLPQLCEAHLTGSALSLISARTETAMGLSDIQSTAEYSGRDEGVLMYADDWFVTMGFSTCLNTYY